MSRLFRVSCDNCPFEKDADSRESAEEIARQHNDQTNHDIVALELPVKR